MLAGTGLEPVIPPRQLCVLRCTGPATTGYGIVAAQPSSIGEAASSAAYSPCSHTELSQYNYHILMLQDWTVCRLKYRGASDVNRLIGYSTKHITFVTPLSRVMGADTGLGETRGVVTIDVFILL